MVTCSWTMPLRKYLNEVFYWSWTKFFSLIDPGLKYPELWLISHWLTGDVLRDWRSRFNAHTSTNPEVMDAELVGPGVVVCEWGGKEMFCFVIVVVVVYVTMYITVPVYCFILSLMRVLFSRAVSISSILIPIRWVLLQLFILQQCSVLLEF